MQLDRFQDPMLISVFHLCRAASVQISERKVVTFVNPVCSSAEALWFLSLPSTCTVSCTYFPLCPLFRTCVQAQHCHYCLSIRHMVVTHVVFAWCVGTYQDRGGQSACDLCDTSGYTDRGSSLSLTHSCSCVFPALGLCGIMCRLHVHVHVVWL